MELDVVSLNNRTNTILIGESKWSDKNNDNRLLAELNKKIALFPHAQNKKIICALFQKKKPSMVVDADVMIFTSSEVTETIRKNQR
jgi:hypothetical protein